MSCQSHGNEGPEDLTGQAYDWDVNARVDFVMFLAGYCMADRKEGMMRRKFALEADYYAYKYDNFSRLLRVAWSPWTRLVQETLTYLSS